MLIRTVFTLWLIPITIVLTSLIGFLAQDHDDISIAINTVQILTPDSIWITNPQTCRDSVLQTQMAITPQKYKYSREEEKYRKLFILSYSQENYTFIKLNSNHTIKSIKINFIRNLILKHDFIVHRINLSKQCRPFIISSCSYTQLFALVIYINKYHKLKLRQTYIIIDGKSHDYDNSPKYIGGGKQIRANSCFTYKQLSPFLIDDYKISNPSENDKLKYKFVKHISVDEYKLNEDNDKFLACKLPAPELVCTLLKSDLVRIALLHDIKVKVKNTVEIIRSEFSKHNCTKCASNLLIFKSDLSKKNNISEIKPENIVKENISTKKITNIKKQIKFPPVVASNSLMNQIIRDWCNDIHSDNIAEEGCTVCGQLTLKKTLTTYTKCSFDKTLLIPSTHGMLDITRLERKNQQEVIKEVKGEVRDMKCSGVCPNCIKSLNKGNLPTNALANSLWLGEIPEQLQNLSYAEQLLIARVRHNRCILRVSSGMHKMRANAIMFANPTPKVYDILPPPIEEISEVLAFIYTGPCQPTKDELKRTPLLVRRNKVACALEWLKLNHKDYADLEISYRNLNEYSEDSPPVSITYHETDGSTNKAPEATAVNDNELEDGVESGECPIIVHGLNGEELSTMSLKALTAVALKHLTEGGKMLAIGHSSEPESIYNNPQLYPKMFPWLFPYGLGGIRNKRGLKQLAENKWKKTFIDVS